MDQKNCQDDRKLPMSVGSSESHNQHLRYMDFPEWTSSTMLSLRCSLILRQDFQEMIQTHLDARKTEYESYRPDEVKKLDGAAVVKSGDYVAVIIADDTAAAEAAFEAELGA